MTLRPKLQKLSNFELKFRNIPQTLAKILPNFISGPKMVRFYELTPRAPIPDGRIEQIMQPCLEELQYIVLSQ